MNSGLVSPAIQFRLNSSAMRVSMAPNRPDDASLVPLLGRQFARQNRDEYEVVDPEHDLQNHQSEQCDPRLGLTQPAHRRPPPAQTAGTAEPPGFSAKRWRVGRHSISPPVPKENKKKPDSGLAVRRASCDAELSSPAERWQGPLDVTRAADMLDPAPRDGAGGFQGMGLRDVQDDSRRSIIGSPRSCRRRLAGFRDARRGSRPTLVNPFRPHVRPPKPRRGSGSSSVRGSTRFRCAARTRSPRPSSPGTNGRSSATKPAASRYTVKPADVATCGPDGLPPPAPRRPGGTRGGIA